MRKLVLIGASTGGPGHLDKIFRALPAGYDATVIVAQHINVQFLPTLCESLSSVSKIGVQMARENETMGHHGYLTHREVNMLQLECGAIRMNRSNPNDDHSPCIDELFLSAVPLVKSGCEILAALLTGIGHDGAAGLLALKKAGAKTLAESEKTAIVYGMPRAAYEIGAVDKPSDLEQIIQTIVAFGGGR